MHYICSRATTENEQTSCCRRVLQLRKISWALSNEGGFQPARRRVAKRTVRKLRVCSVYKKAVRQRRAWVFPEVNTPVFPVLTGERADMNEETESARADGYFPSWRITMKRRESSYMTQRPLLRVETYTPQACNANVLAEGERISVRFGTSGFPNIQKFCCKK